MRPLPVLLALLSAVPLAAAEEKSCCPPPPPPPVTLTLRGEASLELPPDEAQIRFSVQQEAADLAAARAAHNELAARVGAALKEGGVADEDVRADVSISRQVKYQGRIRTRTVTSHRVRTEYEVTARKLDKLDGMLDGLIAAGVKEFTGVAFGLSHPEERMKKLRLEAIGDARRQAESTAERIGVRLGRLLSVSGPSGNAGISGASGLSNQYLIGGVNVTNGGYGAIGSSFEFAPTSSAASTKVDLSAAVPGSPPQAEAESEPVFARPGLVKVKAEAFLTYEIARLGALDAAIQLTEPEPPQPPAAPKPTHPRR